MKFKYFTYIFIILINFTKIYSTEVFTPEKMHSLHRLFSFIISPDNNYIIYINRIWKKEDKTYYTNLEYISIEQYLKKLNGEEIDPKPIEITSPSSEYMDTNPLFSSEYKNILFFLRYDSSGSNIYYIDFPPKENSVPIKLTSYEIDISNIKLQKNTLVFSAEVYFDCEDFNCTKEKDEELSKRGSNTYFVYNKLMMRHWDTWYIEGKSSHPFYQKIKKENNKPILDGKPVDMMFKEIYCSPPLENGEEQFTINDEGNLIAFSAHNKDEKMYNNTKWDIFLYNITTGTRTELTKNEKGRCQNPLFKPNDKDNNLAYLCMLRYGLESDQLSLRVYNPNTGIIKNETNPTKFMIYSYNWSPENGLKFILNTVYEGRDILYSFDFDQRDNIEKCYKNLTSDNNAYNTPIYIFNETKNIIIDYSSFKTPSLLGLLTLNSTTELYESKILYDPNEKEIEKYTMIEPEWFTFIGANNDIIQGWLMKPINYIKGNKYPLAYLINGGPESAWEPGWSYRWCPNIWANHGYAVLMINPHGSFGMGIKFQDSVKNNFAGWPFEDIMKGLDYVINNYDFIDKNRVGACGASYGGYMVNWIQGHNDDNKFKCLVTHSGLFNTLLMFYSIEETFFTMSEFCPIDKWGCKPFEEEYRKGYEEYNPEKFVNHWNTPHLIIHGDNDFRIPITEGLSAFTALQMRGVPSKFIYFNQENHHINNPSNSILWYSEVLGWLDKYLDNNSTETLEQCLVENCKSCISNNNFFCENCEFSDYEVNKYSGSCVKKTEYIPSITFKDIYNLNMNTTKKRNGKNITGPLLNLRGITSSNIPKKHAFILFFIFKSINLEEEAIKISAICETNNELKKTNDSTNIIDYECLGNNTIDINKYQLNNIEEAEKNDDIILIGNLEGINNIINEEKNNLTNKLNSSYTIQDLPSVFKFKYSNNTYNYFPSKKKIFNITLNGEMTTDKGIPQGCHKSIVEITEIKEEPEVNFCLNQNKEGIFKFLLEIKNETEDKIIKFKSSIIKIPKNNLRYLSNNDNNNYEINIPGLEQFNLIYNKTSKSNEESKSRYYRKNKNSSNKGWKIALYIIAGIIALILTIIAFIYIRKNDQKNFDHLNTNSTFV